MPCTVDMSAEYQREAEHVTKMLCALCTHLEEWGEGRNIDQVEGLREWLARHNKLDAERAERARKAAEPVMEPFCNGCGGIGRKAYGSTATFMGGIGGQAITEDLCDKCWGSGDELAPFANARQLRQRARR